MSNSSDPTAVTIRSYNTHAREYAESTRTFSRYPGLEEELRAFCAQIDGTRVVEVGAGAGRDFAVLRDAVPFALATDVLFAMVALIDAPNRVVADVRALPFRPESIDAIWCSAVLHHLDSDDIKVALSECRSVLRPHGLLGISLKASDAGRFVDDDIAGTRWFSQVSISDLRQLLGERFVGVNLWARTVRSNTWLTATARAN